MSNYFLTVILRPSHMDHWCMPLGGAVESWSRATSNPTRPNFGVLQESPCIEQSYDGSSDEHGIFTPSIMSSSNGPRMFPPHLPNNIFTVILDFWYNSTPFLPLLFGGPLLLYPRCKSNRSLQNTSTCRHALHYTWLVFDTTEYHWSHSSFISFVSNNLKSNVSRKINMDDKVMCWKLPKWNQKILSGEQLVHTCLIVALMQGIPMGIPTLQKCATRQKVIGMTIHMLVYGWERLTAMD